MAFELGNERHYEPREVAQVLNKDYQTVLRYLRKGQISHTKINTTYLIAHSDLVAYLVDEESLEESVIQKIISSRLSTPNVQTPKA